MPTIIVTAAVLLIKRIREKQALANALETKLQNIDYLLSLLRPENSNDEKQLALDGFNKNFAKFGSIDPKSDDFQKRIRFISEFAMLDFYEIDKISKFGDSIVSQNREFKKEIERAIGGALKARQKSK